RRVACYNRSKGWECSQQSNYLDVYEYQIQEYLRSFNIPDDYQEKILDAHRKLQEVYDDSDNRRVKLEARLQRIKELYGWGDIIKEQYLIERDAINRELNALTPIKEQGKTLDKLALFLASVADAWDTANQEERNRLARCLFQEIWIKDKEVIAVRPQPELKPFFGLNHEAMRNGCHRVSGSGDPEGI
ncbi:MAG: hypothetical protein ABH934_00430, partial [Chloroflexota bacterium]